MWIEYLVDGLIHYSGHTQHEQGSRIAQHLAPQPSVEIPAEATKLGHEHHHVHSRRYEVGKENVADAEIRPVEP